MATPYAPAEPTPSVPEPYYAPVPYHAPPLWGLLFYPPPSTFDPPLLFSYPHPPPPLIWATPYPSVTEDYILLWCWLFVIRQSVWLVCDTLQLWFGRVGDM